MPFMDAKSLFTIFSILLGTGLFLRMVAKEKRRREKHLLLRLYEKQHADAERQKQLAQQAACEAGTVAQVAELRPPKP